jgi:hypothetical protein
VGEYKSRSNDPRITKGAKKDNDLYQFAYEVALQPADTPERKRMKKDAQNYVRAFESRFQKEAFTLSGGRPYSAGGKGEFVDERFVDKNAANDNKSQTASKRRSVKKAAVKAMPAGLKRQVKAGESAKPLLKKTAKAMPAGVKRKSMAGTAKPFAKKTGKK